VITPEGPRPNGKFVEAVRDYSPPKNVRELRRFLGLTCYYRQFVHQFAKVAEPLHHLTCKNVMFEWSQECQTTFEKLKRRLITAPVLAYPNFDLDFALETDASHQGLGTVIIITNTGRWQVPPNRLCQSGIVRCREELRHYRPRDLGSSVGNFSFLLSFVWTLCHSVY